MPSVTSGSRESRVVRLVGRGSHQLEANALKLRVAQNADQGQRILVARVGK